MYVLSGTKVFLHVPCSSDDAHYNVYLARDKFTFENSAAFRHVRLFGNVKLKTARASLYI